MLTSRTSFILIATLFIPSSIVSSENVMNNNSTRADKSLSFFNVVRFTNGPCVAPDTSAGTCYTLEECSQNGGTGSGSCAQGYGVCCIFEVSCGMTSSENSTYFRSAGATIQPGGSCTASICKSNDNVCQLRLDFRTFVISGPAMNSNSELTTAFGAPAVLGTGAVATTQSQCQIDTFQITSPLASTIPPIICGQNNGEHVYVDASDGCTTLGFQFGVGRPGLILDRRFDILVTQIPCDSSTLAPTGCTQYHYGSTTGTLRTFNYAGGLHLANQNQNICLRRERGMCRVCYSAGMTDFQVSSSLTSGFIGKNERCCGYKKSGLDVLAYDCVIIPSATYKKNPVNMMSKWGTLITKAGDEYCGNALVTVTGMNTNTKTICSQRVPFSIRFLSDNFEIALAEAKAEPDGFKLAFEQMACSSRIT